MFVWKSILAAFESIRIVLAKFGDLRVDYGLTVALVGVIAEVILVICLRWGIHREWGDFGHDGRIPDAIRLDFFNHIFCGLSLLFIVIENRGSILRSDIRTLSVRRSGVMDAEEHIQDRAEGDKIGIKGDLNDFGVTGGPGADILVGGIVDGSTSVSHFDRINPDQFIEDRLKAPKASTPEGGDCSRLRHKLIVSLFFSHMSLRLS